MTRSLVMSAGASLLTRPARPGPFDDSRLRSLPPPPECLPVCRSGAHGNSLLISLITTCYRVHVSSSPHLRPLASGLTHYSLGTEPVSSAFVQV